jgi:uncharacterized protein
VEISPTRTPAPPSSAPRRKSAFGFFGVVLALHALLGLGAQALSPVLGLAWSEVFAFALPAGAATAGANLRPRSFLLLQRRPTARLLVLGFLCGATGFFLAGAVMALASLMMPESWVQASDLTRLFQGPPLERAAVAAIASALAPLCEEAAFRGYLLSALRTRHGPRGAIAWSSLLFAAMHLSPVRFPSVLVLGLLFGWLAWRSGSLWPAVIAHATNNGIASALALAGADDGSRPDARAAALMLAVAAAALFGLCAAYRAATPAPPVAQEAMVREDPADPSVRFRLDRLPPGYRAAAALGVALLLGIAAFAARVAR